MAPWVGCRDERWQSTVIGQYEKKGVEVALAADSGPGKWRNRRLPGDTNETGFGSNRTESEAA
jgi:hypothetical protein